MDNLDFVLSLFSQYLFIDAKNNIEDIEYYFTTNPGTRDNALINELIYAIKTYNLENIDLPLFHSICAKTGKTEMESKEIINKIIEWKNYTQEKMAPAKKYLQDLCSAAVVQRANRMYPNDPTEFLNYLKKSEVKVSKSVDVLSTSSFDSLDINSLVAEGEHYGVPSYFDFINRSFAPHNVVEYGQMGLISMPPGVGKSLFGMTEALNAAIRGERVHYLAMGDLKMNDFIVRLCAIYSGLPFYEARKNIVTIYKNLSEMIGDRLGITCIPAGTITVDEYIDYIIDTDYKILVADYDAGFKNLAMTDSMYLAMGDTYDKLTKLTAAGKLVYILAQPMKASWTNEAIELNEIGESAKKIHCVDFAITRGRCIDSPNHLGIMTMVKNRRGEEGIKAYSVRLNNGRFRIVPKQVYDDLARIKEKMEWTDGDIDFMIHTYEVQHKKIQAFENDIANKQRLGVDEYGNASQSLIQETQINKANNPFRKK